MKTNPTLLMWAALVAATAATLPAQTPVRITADRVNLRAQPRLTAEVVAQAAYDDRLVAREIGEEWVAVGAPASVDLWVMKQYVQTPQNTIGAQRVNVRAGPGINFTIVDTLSLGDQIEPRGEEMGDWIKIAPPPNACVWVSREYVEILGETAGAAESAAQIAPPAEDAPAEQAAGKKKATRQKKSKAPPEAPAPERVLPTPIVSPSVPMTDAAAREIPVPPPAHLKLIPLEGQGRFKEVEGELRAAPLINEAPTRYRIVRWQNNRWQILCHVYGEAAKFRSLQDKRVRMKGREYWIQGAAAPVLIPDQVEEITLVE